MNKKITGLAAGGALIAALASASPASASTSTSSTTTTCSSWKLHADRYIQSCIDITGTQVRTYGFVSSAGTSAAHNTTAAITSRLEGGAYLGTESSTVFNNNNTVRIEGATTTAAAGTNVRSTVYLPNTLGTGTLVGTDDATYIDPDVPIGPSGPPGTPPPVTEQITVWATVTG